MRVLLSAYACAPGRGSEPGIGWNVASEVAKQHDTWVLTSAESAREIRAAAAEHANPQLHFVFIDPFGWTLDQVKRRRRLPWRAHVHYYAWQLRAYLAARKLHRRVQFDIVHHVTYGRYYSPSLVSLLPVPFVWGPVGGGERAPRAFWPSFGLRGVVYESMRSLARSVGELDPLVRLTARRSALARATTRQTAERLSRVGARTIEVMDQTGLTTDELRMLESTARDDQTIPTSFFLSVARLLHWKGIHLGLEAFAQARLDNVEYRIIGWGPERERLVARSHRLGIADRVTFLGELPRPDVLRLLRSSLALIHPSLHDSGGVVCLEAMAAGAPVVCLNVGGPPVQVTDETGFIVPATTPEESILGIADAMRVLSTDPARRAVLAASAHRRANEYEWAQRARLTLDSYDRLHSRTERPS
jgi:glycosyltransferase involved in cell wall biosynthesis